MVCSLVFKSLVGTGKAGFAALVDIRIRQHVSLTNFSLCGHVLSVRCVKNLYVMLIVYEFPHIYLVIVLKQFGNSDFCFFFFLIGNLATQIMLYGSLHSFVLNF